MSRRRSFPNRPGGAAAASPSFLLCAVTCLFQVLLLPPVLATSEAKNSPEGLSEASPPYGYSSLLPRDYRTPAPASYSPYSPLAYNPAVYTPVTYGHYPGYPKPPYHGRAPPFQQVALTFPPHTPTAYFTAFTGYSPQPVTTPPHHAHSVAKSFVKHRTSTKPHVKVTKGSKSTHRPRPPPPPPPPSYGPTPAPYAPTRVPYTPTQAPYGK
ncbi:uncharacterized protein LOC143038350 [Oratosquilla oratoria]|uniref:uncharacterized protein LOC143038350 n=1 Tax=Oratosquilla oratoria TaxID=337810 RepID=UPI003F76375A